MTNYTKSTNFATKDSLASGNALKIVKGTELNTEFDNIATAVTSKSDTTSPTFTGTVTIPTLAYAGTTLTAGVTGTGKMVLDASPTLITPTLGVATATSVNKLTLTTPATSATLTIADGSSLITSGAYSLTLTTTAATNVTLPTTGTLASLTGTQTFTNKTITSPTINGTPVMGASVLTQGTSKTYNWNSSSTNTALEFTTIPSWVKRITVMLSSLSTTGTAINILQLGTGATPTYVTTGYAGTNMSLNNGNTPNVQSYSTGVIFSDAQAAGDTVIGNLIIANVTGNKWNISGNVSTSNTRCGLQTCTVDLGAVLTALRIYSGSATEYWDAGTMNILYE